MCGDEPWYHDADIRQGLYDKVVAAHAEQKILVGPPADEISRICPSGGRMLAAGGVLRLGGVLLGGYGETDIGYAYRHLSRALHPDKNRSIPEAADAFKRLQEAADELRQTLEQQRAIMKAICEAMGGAVTPQMSERPQWALFAEVSRMLSGVLGLCGEGAVPSHSHIRGSVAFATCGRYHGCEPAALMGLWFDSNSLLDCVGSGAVRNSYDCSPKHLRAAFLCALYRATIAEDKRLGGIRGSWQAVFSQFPELGLWKELREKFRLRTADRGSKWDAASEFQPSEWAKGWRDKIREALATGVDEAVPAHAPEVRKLAGDLWKDLAEWAASQGLQRNLELFTAAAEGSESAAPSTGVQDTWAFVPAVDLYLMRVVGEGMVGTTAEGIFLEALQGVAKPPSKEPAAEAEEDAGQPKSLSKAEEQKLAMKDMDWEKIWRQKNQAQKFKNSSRGRNAGWQRGHSPSRRCVSSSSPSRPRRRRRARSLGPTSGERCGVPSRRGNGGGPRTCSLEQRGSVLASTRTRARGLPRKAGPAFVSHVATTLAQVSSGSPSLTVARTVGWPRKILAVGSVSVRAWVMVHSRAEGHHSSAPHLWHHLAAFLTRTPSRRQLSVRGAFWNTLKITSSIGTLVYTRPSHAACSKKSLVLDSAFVMEA
ncbi:unnamed protein product [Prorocentrum cordatum]|uniref:J domain-containing protein n=1 Tax=Prorocentrum cordatum TaxID=2364126 RepID=A0ABN9S6H5_9DINO|nr:unnamed protein product [Polarella glacialis]